MSHGDDSRNEPRFGYQAGAERQEPYLEDLRSSGAMVTRRKRKPLVRTFLVGAAIILFCGFVVIAYRRHPVEVPSQLPVITAEMTPVKVKPDNPGGMDIPYQDTTVYDELARHGKAKRGPNEVEHLLQPPEEPLPAPAVEEPKVAAPSPSTPSVEEKPAEQQAPVEPATPATEAPEQNDNEAALAPAPAPSASRPAAKLPLPPSDDNDSATDADAPKAASKPATAPAKIKPSGSGTIQLGAFRDEAGANAEWKRLQSHHSDQLGSLSPTVSRVVLGDKGIWYRLKAGPIGGDSAKQVCATLKAANVSCLVSQH